MQNWVSGKSVLLENESVVFVDGDEERGTGHVVRIDRTAEPVVDIDVQGQFVIIDGAPGLFWRETFQHRMYRQGLFLIQDEMLSSYCVGLGGVGTTR